MIVGLVYLNLNCQFCSKIISDLLILLLSKFKLLSLSSPCNMWAFIDFRLFPITFSSKRWLRPVKQPGSRLFNSFKLMSNLFKQVNPFHISLLILCSWFCDSTRFTSWGRQLSPPFEMLLISFPPRREFCNWSSPLHMSTEISTISLAVNHNVSKFSKPLKAPVVILDIWLKLRFLVRSLFDCPWLWQLAHRSEYQ